MKTFDHKKILSLLLVVLLLAPSAYGLEKLGKEEVVYGKLDFKGQPGLLIVVSGFPQGFKGYDHGDFSQVSNLSTSEELDYKGKRIKIDAGENFYYQGNLKEGELPWLVDMVWKLDGKKVTEDQLLGASGKLELDFKIDKNPKAQTIYYDYYVVQAGFHFNVDQVSNLEAKEGTLAAAGSTKMVNFMSLPGRGGSYKLTADVKDYEPGMVQIAGLPLSMDFDLGELSDYTGDLKTLEMAIGQLDDGTQEFLEGLRQLAEGTALFSQGGSEVASGSNQLSQGLWEIAQGSRELKNGVDQLGWGLRELVYAGKGGLGTEVVNQENLVSASAIFKGVFDMLAQMADLDMSEEEAQLLLDALETISQVVLPGIAELDRERLEEFSESLLISSSELEESIASLEEISFNLKNPPSLHSQDDDIDTLALDESGYMQSQAQALDEEIEGLKKTRLRLAIFGEFFDGLIDVLMLFEDQFISLQDKLVELQEGLEELDITAKDLLELQEMLGELSLGYSTFHDGLVLYMDGVEGVYWGVAGRGALSSGLSAFSSGLYDLAQGMEDFDQGLGLYVHGFWPIHQGLQALYSGGLELGQGTSMMRQETEGIDKKMEVMVQEELEALSAEGVDFPSFTSKNNKEVESVQFVMLYEGRSLPQQELDNGLEEEKNFLERFIDLFRKTD